MGALFFFKSHVKGYVKKDGTTVRGHDDKRNERHELPSSDHIETLDAAAEYWRHNFSGKIIPVIVHAGGRKIPIKVRFDAGNDHAYTSDDGGKQKTGARSFDVARAVAMDRILQVISNPKRRIVNHGADLFLERMIDGKHYTVVLTWRDAAKVYEFHSAHFKSIDDVRSLQERQDSRKNNGPLQKGGPFSAFPDLQASYECGIAPIGVTTSCEVGSGQTRTTVPEVTVFFKSIEIRPDVVFAKSHVKGHTKKNGTVVKDYERGLYLLPKPQHHTGILSLFSHGKPKAIHPKVGDKGERVGIYSPHTATMPDTWEDPDAVATFTPGSAVPGEISGITLAHWTDHPDTLEEWGNVEGQMPDLVEPPLQMKSGKQAASGVIIEDPDGRVWVISPTNKFGGYRNTFPKGKEEDELTLQANAIKEAFEESGLKVEITGLHGDFERTTSVTRYYTAKRVGGSPADMGWESQAVHLVPKHMLMLFLDSQNDRDVIAWS